MEKNLGQILNHRTFPCDAKLAYKQVTPQNISAIL